MHASLRPKSDAYGIEVSWLVGRYITTYAWSLYYPSLLLFLLCFWEWCFIRYGFRVSFTWMLIKVMTSCVQVIGEWRDVTSTCRRGHLQPQVLFYEAVRSETVPVTVCWTCHYKFYHWGCGSGSRTQPSHCWALPICVVSSKWPQGVVFSIVQAERCRLDAVEALLVWGYHSSRIPFMKCS